MGVLLHAKSNIALVVTILLAATSGILAFQVRICNRGICYTKQESPSDKTKLAPHLMSSAVYELEHGSTSPPLNFCTGNQGRTMDCQQFEILASFEDFDSALTSVEDTMKSFRSKHDKVRPRQRLNRDETTGRRSEGMPMSHVSWKEKPLRGQCYDSHNGKEFSCHLIRPLDDGVVFFEDISVHGTVLVAQPKSKLSTRNSNKNGRSPRATPNVMVGSEYCNPMEDVRVNISINLEGI